jgi:hypothetical protein
MSNEQNSASRGGEFADVFAAGSGKRSDLLPQLEKHSAVTKPVAFNS